MKNVLQHIAENTNAKSGITLVRLSRVSGLGVAKLKETLNTLHKSGEIQVREGINAKLIFPLTKNQ